MNEDLKDPTQEKCPTCNGKKSGKFPIDFYTNDELKELSKLTGIGLKKEWGFQKIHGQFLICFLRKQKSNLIIASHHTLNHNELIKCQYT